MPETTAHTLAFYEQRGDLELGRGDVISTGDLATWPGDYPVYSSSAVGEGVFGRYARHMFDEELITWSIDGGGRPFHRRRHRFSVTNVCGFLRVKRPDRWDYGYLHTVLEKLQSGIQFDYQMKAHPSVIRELYRFDCIPIEEQRRIAAVRDTLDTTIRQTEAMIEKLKQVKQGLLHDLLTRGIDANGELRPPQSQAPQLYKESPLGWIPDSWQAITVGEACDLHNGLRLPLASDVRENMLGPFPYYGPTGILDHINEFRADGTFVLLGEDGDHFLKFANRPMTQLVSGKFNVNNHAHLLSGSLCRTEWVDVWFRHRDITLFLTRQGAGRFKLNKASLLSLPLAVPSDREQGSVLVALGSMEDRIATEQRTRDKLLAQKSGLMDDLLTGRVRVTALLAAATP